MLPLETLGHVQQWGMAILPLVSVHNICTPKRAVELGPKYEIGRIPLDKGVYKPIWSFVQKGLSLSLTMRLLDEIVGLITVDLPSTRHPCSTRLR